MGNTCCVASNDPPKGKGRGRRPQQRGGRRGGGQGGAAAAYAAAVPPPHAFETLFDKYRADLEWRVFEGWTPPEGVGTASEPPSPFQASTSQPVGTRSDAPTPTAEDSEAAAAVSTPTPPVLPPPDVPDIALRMVRGVDPRRLAAAKLRTPQEGLDCVLRLLTPIWQQYSMPGKAKGSGRVLTKAGLRRLVTEYLEQLERFMPVLHASLVAKYLQLLFGGAAGAPCESAASSPKAASVGASAGGEGGTEAAGAELPAATALSAECLEGLKHSVCRKLQDEMSSVVWDFFVSFKSNDGELVRTVCGTIWNRLDLNRDGKVDREEFHSCFLTATEVLAIDTAAHSAAADHVLLAVSQTLSSHLSMCLTPGITGLANLGNSCYMNAALQVLSATPLLRSHLLASSDLDAATPAAAADTDAAAGSPKAAATVAAAPAAAEQDLQGRVVELLAAMWGKLPAVTASPHRVKEGLKASPFGGYEQHDAHELLEYLLDQLHEGAREREAEVREREEATPTAASSPTSSLVPLSLASTLRSCDVPDDDDETVPASARLSDAELGALWWARHLRFGVSEVARLFHGQLKSVVTCNECGKDCRAFDAFNSLSIPIGNGTETEPVQACLERHFREERVTRFCPRCMKDSKNCVKRTQLHTLPRYLVLHIRRLHQTKTQMQKAMTVLHANKTLDVSAHLSRPAADAARWAWPEAVANNQFNCCPFGLSTPLYELYGIINHFGTLQGGHYTALTADERNDWHCYDDSFVTKLEV